MASTLGTRLYQIVDPAFKNSGLRRDLSRIDDVNALKTFLDENPDAKALVAANLANIQTRLKDDWETLADVLQGGQRVRREQPVVPPAAVVPSVSILSTDTQHASTGTDLVKAVLFAKLKGTPEPLLDESRVVRLSPAGFSQTTSTVTSADTYVAPAAVPERIVPGFAIDPILRPLPSVAADVIKITDDLDAQIETFYLEMTSFQPGRFNPIKAVKRWITSKQDKFNAILGKNQDLLGDLMKFVDVLPQIQNDPAEVLGHLKDYFPKEDPRLPGLVNFGLKLAKRFKSETGMKLATGVIIWAVSKMAERFIAGATVKEAKPRFHALAKNGVGIIGDILGEAVKTEDEARAYIDDNKRMVEELAADTKLIRQIRKNWKELESRAIVPLFAEAHRYDFQISIKLSSFYSQWNTSDPEGTAKVVKERLRELLKKIQDTERLKGVKIGLTVDLEQYEYRDLTYKIFKDVMNEVEFRHMERVGVVVQTYLKDAPQIIHDLAIWSQARSKMEHGGKSIQIRPVKGAYVDFEKMRKEQKGYPLATVGSKEEADVNYHDCVDLLYAYKDHLRTSIASHNDQTYLESIAKAIANQVPIEVQGLLGMQDDRKAQLFEMGIPVSSYNGIGNLLKGMAFLARRFLENASQSNFLFKVASTLSNIGKILRYARKYAPEKVALARQQLDDILKNPRAGKRLAIDRTIAPETPARDLAHPYRREPLTDFSRDFNQQLVTLALKKHDAAWWADLTAPIDARFLVPDAELTPGKKVVLGKAAGKDKSWDDYPDIGLNPTPVEPAWPTRLKSVNPANTSEVIGEIDLPKNEVEVNQAVANAQAGFLKWSHFSVYHRVGILRKTAERMRQEKPELTALIMKESGKSIKEADADVAEAIDFIEYYSREAIRMIEENPDREITARGVTAVIAPWNFPLAILTGMTAAALVTGNSVVMKPSEETPIIARKLYQLLLESGVTPQAIQYQPGDGRVAKAILDNPLIKTVAFTGSKARGLEIYQNMIPKGATVVTEMGGKNALIVDSDAHPDDIINAVINGKFGYAGQKCSAIDRLIIVGDQTRYNEIVKRLKKAVEALKVGNPEDYGYFNGAVIRQSDKDRLLKILSELDQGKIKGKILYDGRKHKIPTNGHYVGPSLIETDDYEGTLFQDEFFGSLLAITRVNTLEEAVAIAKKIKYGLTGGYIGRSPSRKQYVLENWTPVGDLYINNVESGTTAAGVGEQSFGGVGLSGANGSKAGGPQYLWQFVDAQWKTGKVPEHPITFVKNKIENILDYPNKWHPLYSPLGIKNSINFYPRGSGYIVVDKKNIRNTMILQAAAHAAGYPAGVLVIDQQNPHGGKSVRMPYWDGNKIVEMTLPVLDMETVKHFISQATAKWVAFANPEAARPELLTAASKTWIGQSFVRSVMTFTDPTAEIEKLASMLLEPRTVCDNLSRHGFVAPDESGEITPASSGENDLGGEDQIESPSAADGNQTAGLMQQSAEGLSLGMATLGPLAGGVALTGMLVH